MIDQVAEKAARWLIQYHPKGLSEFNVLKYGISIATYTALSTLGLLLVGLLLGDLLSAIIIIAVFYFNQTAGGGVHAKTHAGCFWTMVGFLSLAICLCRLQLEDHIKLCIGSIAVVALFLMPVILHDKRAHLSERLPVFTRINRVCVLCEAMALAILYGIRCLPSAYVYALALSALSRLVAWGLKSHKLKIQ